MVPTQTNSDDIVARLHDNFFADARDRLETVDGLLDALRGSPGEEDEAALDIRHEVRNLKGMGLAFGFMSISLILNLLEDYMASVDPPLARHVAQTRVFHDTLADIVDQGTDPGDTANADNIRRMPVHSSPDAKPKAPVDINVLLVIPSRSISQFVSRSLAAREFRSSAVRTAAEAFDLVAVMRPDIVITSAVLGAINGTDLVRALTVMSITAATRFAVVTSFDRLIPNFETCRPVCPSCALAIPSKPTSITPPPVSKNAR